MEQSSASLSVAPADPWGSELQQALYRLWLGKRDRGRAMPAWSAIDPIELRQWLGDLHLLEVIDGGRDFRYRVHGTRIGRQHGNEMTGKLVSEWPQEIQARAYRTYRRIASTAKPHLVCECETFERYPQIKHRLVLPFGADGATVDKLLVHLVLGGRTAGETDAEYYPLD